MTDVNWGLLEVIAKGSVEYRYTPEEKDRVLRGDAPLPGNSLLFFDINPTTDRPFEDNSTRVLVSVNGKELESLGPGDWDSTKSVRIGEQPYSRTNGGKIKVGLIPVPQGTEGFRVRIGFSHWEEEVDSSRFLETDVVWGGVNG